MNRIFNIYHLGKSLKSTLDHESICPCDGSLAWTNKVEWKGCYPVQERGNLTQIRRSNRLSVIQDKLCSCLGFNWPPLVDILLIWTRSSLFLTLHHQTKELFQKTNNRSELYGKKPQCQHDLSRKRGKIA